ARVQTEAPDEVGRRGLLRKFPPDDEEPTSGFDLQKIPQKLKIDEDKEIQPRYKMQLWVEATDNDIESGKHVGATREKFTFLLVSETELLAEISKEEEAPHLKFEGM